MCGAADAANLWRPGFRAKVLQANSQVIQTAGMLTTATQDPNPSKMTPADLYFSPLPRRQAWHSTTYNAMPWFQHTRPWCGITLGSRA
jgi:hypothetical protein